SCASKLNLLILSQTGSLAWQGGKRQSRWRCPDKMAPGIHRKGNPQLDEDRVLGYPFGQSG
ncbi:hypothetical protein NW819_11985, partial [Synechococcus sp. R8-2]|uniref:hypothetical protein n=1 Tax=Synechococcus sp. R8-2 TaxID=2291959 RepID=UPI0039C28449